MRKIALLLAILSVANCKKSNNDNDANLFLLFYLTQPVASPSTAVVTTFAGSVRSGFVDGTGTNARFNNPAGLILDSANNVYVGDTSNNAIRKITSAGVVTIFAGSASGTTGSVDGTGTAARFYKPASPGIDSNGNLYVPDTINNTIRKITSSGVVSTFAGLASAASGLVDGTGTAARFTFPSGVAGDSAGNVYVADQSNHAIRKITSAGVVTTFAGSTSGTFGFVDGTGTAARFTSPSGVAVDSEGNVYVADFNNHAIRKITTAGVVTTLAGSTSGTTGSVDGTGTAARFNYPAGIAVDSRGNLFVADRSNHAIRKITSAGVVTTLAGSTSRSFGFVDGIGTAARFDYPAGIAIDSAGNIFVADSTNNAIRKIVP